jgi:hypothetical protein
VNLFTFPIIPRKRIIGASIGEYPSQRRGQGADFIEKRPYQSTDPIRTIDQKETAKRSSQRGYFTPWIRMFRRDEMMHAVLVVDRSPRMSLYPRPWLSKQEVIVRAGQMIVDSLKESHSLIGYLDYADWAKDGAPFWRPPNQETEALRVRNRNLPYKQFTAPEDNLSMALQWLLASKRQVPPESFIFLLSDFLLLPPDDLLETVTVMWDIVPVIIQDETLEASFPVWQGRIPISLPCVFLSNGQKKSLVMSGEDSFQKRKENRERMFMIL